MSSENAITPAPPRQLPLDLGIEVEKTIGGVVMGVLQNGIPYLSQTGLAAVCGAGRSTIFDISAEWEAAMREGVIAPRSRVAFFYNSLMNNGYREGRLFIEILKNGTTYNAYPDIVCMAFLEYFSFESQRTNNTATQNYRNFARYGFQEFVYKALGYVPEDPWRLHNERVSLLSDSVPIGYFSVFRESSGLIIDLINAGLPVNQHTIPDSSVGITWGAYWTDQGLSSRFGDRIKYPHYYPSAYPQSASNPQAAWAYPNEAWATFQSWLRTIYLPTKYPSYILRKANVLLGGHAEAQRLANMYQPEMIEDNSKR